MINNNFNIFKLNGGDTNGEQQRHGTIVHNSRFDFHNLPDVFRITGFNNYRDEFAVFRILGFLFIFYIDALSFLVAIQFYLIGFILIIFGIIGLLSRISAFYLFTSILIFVMGIISIALGAFAWAQPMYIAIIIGLILIIEGVALLFLDQ